MNTYSSGKITNILSNDASQIELLFYFIHYIWVSFMMITKNTTNEMNSIQVGPLILALVIFFFWGYVRYITFIAVGYTLLLLLIQTSFGRLYVYLR